MTVETKKLKINYCGRLLEIEYFFQQGEKAMVLYLHGLGCSKSDFLGAAETKSLKVYTLIGFDFPGHGGSSYSENLDIDDLVEITNIFAEQLNLNNIILIGHSMGGLVALLFAEKYNVKVKAFINIEGNLNADDCFFSRQVAEVDFDTFQRKTFRNFRLKLKKYKNTGFRKYAEILENFQPIKAIYDYSPSMVKYSDSGKLIEKFTALKIPKLFICGSENMGLSYISDLKQKDCQVSEIGNSNHFPQHDNASEFYMVISNFLAKV